MPLPTLNWRAVTPAAVTLGTTTGLLDVLYNIGQAVTYSDGSARAPGTGSAWFWGRQQVGGNTEACWGVPPTNPLNCGYIVAGSATAGLTPTQNSSEGAYVANLLMVAMNKNSGSPVNLANLWTNAAPFGAGQFSGYINGGSGLTNGQLYYWECQEAFLIQLVAAGGTSYCLGGGAFIDPRNSSAANCETDGRIYSVTSTGGGRTWATNWTQSNLAAAYGVFKGRTSAVASASRCVSFAPGSATSNVIMFNMLSVPDVSWISPGGEIPFFPVNITASLANGSPTNPYFGELRNVYFMRSATAGQLVTNGGVVQGYVLAPATTSTQAALVLKY